MVFVEQNADYVLSLAAINEMGVSPLVYQMATIREQSIVNTLETSNPILPPIGLKTNVISPNAIEMSWTDNSLLDLDVIIDSIFLNNYLFNKLHILILQLNMEDERLYIVRYNVYSLNNPRYKYVNTTELSCIINDLKPNTQYEFTVKLIKVNFKGLLMIIMIYLNICSK